MENTQNTTDITPEEFRAGLISKLTEMLHEQPLLILDMLYAVIKGTKHFTDCDTQTKAGIVLQALEDCNTNLHKCVKQEITANELVNTFVFASSSFLAFVDDVTDVEFVTDEVYAQKEAEANAAISQGPILGQDL